LNLNTATRAELTRLPRVGEQTADRIIQFREQQGPITGVRQLRNADVLSAAAWRNIRDLVRF
jgi:competence protein ComEA